MAALYLLRDTGQSVEGIGKLRSDLDIGLLRQAEQAAEAKRLPRTALEAVVVIIRGGRGELTGAGFGPGFGIEHLRLGGIEAMAVQIL